MDLNRTTLIGRLPQEAELRSLPSGAEVLSFAVATNRRWTDKKKGELQKETEFHRIVAWGRLAQTLSQYLSKGRQVYVEGRLHTRDWTGEDGIKRYRSEVVADSVILLGPRPAAGNSAAAPVEPIETAEVIEEEIKVENIPF